MGLATFLTAAVTVLAVVLGVLQFVPRRVNIPANMLDHHVMYIPGLLSEADGNDMHAPPVVVSQPVDTRGLDAFALRAASHIVHFVIFCRQPPHTLQQVELYAAWTLKCSRHCAQHAIAHTLL